MIFRLRSEFFYSNELREKRYTAARGLLDGKTDDPQVKAALHDVLNFFEMVGFLRRVGAIDDEAASALFYDWITGWYRAAEEWVKLHKENTPQLPIDYRQLVLAVQNVEMKKGGFASIKDIDDDDRKHPIEEFLRSEANLTSQPASTANVDAHMP